MAKAIFQTNNYAFKDYAEMPLAPDELAAAFGYSFASQVLTLPRYQDYNPSITANLQNTCYTILPKIALTSEMAKREFLVAPLLLEVAKLSPAYLSLFEILIGSIKQAPTT